MNLLFLGDIVGRSGRDAVLRAVPRLRKERDLDFVVVSGDNAAAGFGLTPAIATELLANGVDVITCGDHVWDQKDLITALSRDNRILRPHNFPTNNPGTGFGIYTTAKGKRVAVLHLLGQVFHKEYADNPFACAEEALKGLTMPGGADAIIVDIHAEATSEKTAMGHFLDGRVSLVIGSHTHIPTGDARVLNKGTAYQTDAGMCGDYNSVIGFEPSGPLSRFLTKMHKTKMEPAAGEATLCGLYVETDDATGLAKRVEVIKQGGCL